MISGISSTDPLSLGAAETASNELGKDAFLTLLVEQMRNQDPLSPTENEAFIAQLAQFSTLEETQELNDNIVGLAVLQQSNALMSQLTDSSALIGRTVRYVHPESGEETLGSVESVRIQDGLAVLHIDGEDVPLGNVTEVTADGTAPEGDGDGDGDGGSDGDGSDDSEDTL